MRSSDFDSTVFEDYPSLTRQDICDAIKRRMMTPSPTSLRDMQVPDILDHADFCSDWSDQMDDSGIKMDFMDVSDMSIPDFEHIDDLVF